MVFLLFDVCEDGVEGLFGDGDWMSAKEGEVALVLVMEAFEILLNVIGQFGGLARSF